MAITTEIAERPAVSVERSKPRAKLAPGGYADRATAQAHGLTLGTSNARDFEDCGLSLLDPSCNRAQRT